jgi:hypothetical protein
LGLGFGLEPQISGSDSMPAGLRLESCAVKLGLDSRHAGLRLDSDLTKHGLVASLGVQELN